MTVTIHLLPTPPITMNRMMVSLLHVSQCKVCRHQMASRSLASAVEAERDHARYGCRVEEKAADADRVGARHPRSVRRGGWCVPFFFKQWGGKTAKAGGRELDGRTWDEMPEATRRT